MYKINKIIETIEHILKLCDEMGGAENALNDSHLYRPAILKLFDYASELSQKILKDENLKEFYTLLKDDIRGLKDIRNYSAHDYDGVDLYIIETAIKYDLPLYKEKLKDILKHQETHDHKKRLKP